MALPKMAIIPDSPIPGIGTELPQGSIVTNSYVERTVTVYAVHEPEVETLSILNGLSNLFLSLGCLFLSLPIGAWLNEQFSDPKPEARSAIRVLFWLGLGVAVLFFLLTIGTFFKRGSVWKKIKTQSRNR